MTGNKNRRIKRGKIVRTALDTSKAKQAAKKDNKQKNASKAEQAEAKKQEPPVPAESEESKEQRSSKALPAGSEQAVIQEVAEQPKFVDLPLS